MRRMWIGIAMAGVVVSATVGGAAERKAIDLMGQWKLLPVEGKDLGHEVPPVDDRWLDYTAPALWTDQKHDSAWIVKDVEVAPEDANQVFKFVFHGVYFHVKLFVNGRPVAEHVGGEVPFVCTVPDGVFRPGQNRIALGMINASVVRRDGKCIWKDGVGEGWLWCHAEHFMPCSIHQGKVGIWQPAELLILPRVYIDDVFVRTSTRRMHMDADVEVVNATDKPQLVTVRGRVFDLQEANPEAERLAPPIVALPADATPLKVFWPIYQTLQPGERRVITVGGSWCDRPLVGEKAPQFWSPETPKLYHFQADLSIEGENGPSCDACLTRFGFREVWIENGKIMLNGRPTFLGGTSFHDNGNLDVQNVFDSLRYFKHRLWMNAVRAHVNWFQKTTLQGTDELGLLVLIQPPIAAGATGVPPDFWGHVKRMYLEYIKAYRNCPSILIWSTDNECTFTSGMPDMWAPSIPALTDLMDTFRKVDPTRLVTSSHAYDLRGRSDFFDAGYNNHAYCTRFPSDMYQYKSWYFDFNRAWDRVKPIVVDEWGEGFGADVASAAFGDIVFRHPHEHIEFQDIQDMRSLWVRYHQAWAQYLGLMETRKQGAVSVLMCFGDRMGYWYPRPDKMYNYISLPEVVWDCAHKNFNSIGVYPSDLYRAYTAGRRMIRPYTVINESGSDLDATLRWTLVTGPEVMEINDSGPWQIDKQAAQVLASGEIPVSVGAGRRRTFDLAADLPAVHSPQALNLRVALVRDGKTVYSDSQQYAMFPPASLARTPRFALIGGGESQAFFKAMQARCEARDVAGAIASRLPIVVGRDASISAEEWKQLERHVSAGGKLLVLARRGLPDFFLNVPLIDSGQEVTFAHPRARQHPIIAGLPAVSAFWWPEWKGDERYDDFIVAQDTLSRPYQGNFRILMDAGIGSLDAGQGLSLAPMLEVVAGKGRAIFCSLMLQEKATLSPAAAWLLRKSIEDLQREGQPLKPVVALGVDLSRVHAEQLPAETPLDPATVAAVVVDGTKPIPSDQAPRLVAFAKAGGTVIVHNTQPETAEAIGRAFGIALKAYVAPLHGEFCRAFGIALPEGKSHIRWVAFDPSASPLFDGMSHYDLNWTWSSGLGRFNEKGVLADVTLASDSPGVVEAARPGVLLVLKLGRGTVLFDQVLWDVPGKGAYVQARADEYIAQLLTNAGVQQAPPTTAGGKIAEWLILGPFKIPNVGRGAQKVMELPDEAAYEAVEGQVYQRKREDGAIETRTWTRAKLNVRAGAANNLNSHFGQPDWTRPTWDYYVAYAQAYIVSDDDQDVLLCGGADDSLKIYLNGTLLETEENLGNLRSDEDVQIQVRLKKGKNRVFVKCANWLGQWGFIVKVKNASAPISFRVE